MNPEALWLCGKPDIDLQSYQTQDDLLIGHLAFVIIFANKSVNEDSEKLKSCLSSFVSMDSA
jgi:hypothetical protein